MDGATCSRGLIVLAAVIVTCLGMNAQAREPTPEEVFRERLLPIFNSPNPSSCVQCHLAGVDLKDYILPDAEKTFQSLRDQGLIDLVSPEKSKILSFIGMGEGKSSSSVQEKMRAVEREAFSSWIRACSADPKLRSAPKLDGKDRARPAAADEVIRYARKDRVLDSFERNVWAWRFRCMNCHTEGTSQNEKLRKEHGDRVAWVKKAGAEATMEYLITSALVDPNSPEKSLLLTKPLGAEEHGGGVKFTPGDQGYKGFRVWLEDLASVRGGQMKKPSDLPPKDNAPLRFGTELWLKLENTPLDWAEKLLAVTVFAWNPKEKSWEATPVATSDRVVSGKGNVWQHTLTLLADEGSERARAWKGKPTRLPPGRYLVRVYVDRNGKLAKDWKAELGRTDFAGEAAVEIKAWRDGYSAMTVLDARTIRK